MHVKGGRGYAERSLFRTLTLSSIIFVAIYLFVGTMIVWMDWTTPTLIWVFIGLIPVAIWLSAWVAFFAGVWEIDKRKRALISRWRVALVGLMATVGTVLHLCIWYIMVTGFS